MKTKLLLILTVLLFVVSTGWTIGDVDRVEDLIDNEITTMQDTLDARAEHQWQNLRLVIDFDASGPWEEETPHEFMTINGSVEFKMTAYCSTNVVGTDTLTFFFPLTVERAISFKGDEIDAGEVIIGLSTVIAYDANLIDPGPSLAITRLGYGQWWEGVIHGISGAAESWDYDIDGGALTGGIIVILVKWRPCMAGSGSAMTVGGGG